jgi:hypothetical protein
MRWRKFGPVAMPLPRPDWMATHAAVPFIEPVDRNLLKVWFGGRDAANRSHTGWCMVDLREPNRAREVSPAPVLAPGALGGFDDSGAMPSWIARQGERRLLYYIGWNLGVTVPFRNAVGLAVAGADGVFRREYPGPILDRTASEPHFVASCSVVPDAGVWRMWYTACSRWEPAAGAPRHWYHIRYAESDDAVTWRRDGRVAIDFADAGEYAISRPSVIRDADRWRMWYSCRGERYRIGYAESADGRTWRRLDADAGIDVSATGWDSEMIEYPHVFDHEGRRYMAYNGNGYGATGFGLAVLDAG